MKQHVLRGPLLNTAAVLVFFLVMLSISMANPEATVLGSLWLIILTFLRTLQWLLGMLLAVIFCLAFLIAVFFGAVALASPAASVRMYAGFRQTLTAWLEEVKESLLEFGSCKKNGAVCER
ncbi:hypothetical protein [Candidatus Electronema sp. PJ]|uniref:hypothetical protein n=1 Tax=Candidatus Electronema sp. PJ TaxID=3401572 RepID=UPI003AA929C7